MRTTGNRRWSSALAIAVGLGLLATGAMFVLIVWAEKGVGQADPVASVVGGLLACAGSGVTLMGWAAARRRAAALPATADQINQAVITLAGAVREQWTREAKVRALGDPEPMPVRWRLASTELMDHPNVINSEGSVVFTGSSDRITGLTAAFQALPRRRLVITGGPGAGKTTLALQLLLELLPAPGESPTEPVPVLISPLGWEPSIQPNVHDFLGAQLDFVYPALKSIHPDAATTLVAQGRVLPILDGLDEIPPAQRAAIITALNETLSPEDGLILTSRRPEYRTAIEFARDRLTAAAVITPYALTFDEAASYLRKHLHGVHDPAWMTILNQLETGRAPNLAMVTATPLGLWLVRVVYLDSGRAAFPYADPMLTTPGHLRQHLLDQLIPALIRARPPHVKRRRDDPSTPLRPDRMHRPDDLQRWLTTIARQLRDSGTRDWAWWNVASYTFTTSRARLAIRLLIGLICFLAVALIGTATGTLVAALMSLLIAWLVKGTAFGVAVGLTVALLLGGSAVGLSVGIVGGANFGLSAIPHHGQTRIRGRARELIKTMRPRLLAGLTIGLTLGLAAGLMTEMTIGLTTGLTFGLTIALTLGLAAFVQTDEGAMIAASPTWSFKRDSAFALIASLAGGAAFGLAGGLTVGLAVGLTVGATAGLVVGLTAGMIGGLSLGLIFGAAIWWVGSASYAFRISVLAQWIRRRPGQLPPPWRMMPVLEDCHRIGLLRAVGPIYQFRHAELQDHLAPPNPS